MNQAARSIVLHSLIIAVLIAMFFVLSEYYSGNLARILVLAVFAMGYNVLFG